MQKVLNLLDLSARMDPRHPLKILHPPNAGERTGKLFADALSTRSLSPRHVFGIDEKLLLEMLSSSSSGALRSHSGTGPPRPVPVILVFLRPNFACGAAKDRTGVSSRLSSRSNGLIVRAPRSSALFRVRYSRLAACVRSRSNAINLGPCNPCTIPP